MDETQLLQKIHDDPGTTSGFGDVAEFAAEKIGIKRGQHGEEEWWMDGFCTGAAYISETNSSLIALAFAAEHLNHIFAQAGKGEGYPLQVTTNDSEFAEYFNRAINTLSQCVSNTHHILEQIRHRRGEVA